MKPGPPPKPTALKLLEGYSKDRINENEPCPPPAVDLTPPDGLMTPEAIAEWHRTAPALAASGVLTTADITGFVMYCNLYAQYINISKITLDCEIVEAPRTGTVITSYSIHYTKLYDITDEDLLYKNKWALIGRILSGPNYIKIIRAAKKQIKNSAKPIVFPKLNDRQIFDLFK